MTIYVFKYLNHPDGGDRMETIMEVNDDNIIFAARAYYNGTPCLHTSLSHTWVGQHIDVYLERSIYRGYRDEGRAKLDIYKTATLNYQSDYYDNLYS